jgi:hypothetical protein
VLAILKLYGRLVRKAARLALRAWPLAPLLLGYMLAVVRLAGLLAPLGPLLGSLAMYLALAALLSSYLHLMSSAVNGQRLRASDFLTSFRHRFGDVVSVLFAFWIIGRGVGLLTANMGDKGNIVAVLVSLAMTVFFNPVPELIYQGSSRSFALLADSARFISAHWPEWLAPNVVLAAALLAPVGLLGGLGVGAGVLRIQAVFSLGGLINVIASFPPWLWPAVLLLVHFAMVFRGLLFQELSSGISARQRAIRDAWGR